MTAQPKKPKAPLPFADARKACRTITEREQLERVVTARWTSSELREYSRLHFPKNGKDYPTAASYRKALKDIANVYENARISDYASEWRKQFRKGGSKPLPPRREGLLIRGRGQPYRVDHQEYCWYAHTEEYRSLIEQRARDYFKIQPEQPCHVNAWAASQRAYWREQEQVRKQAEMKAKAPKSPKKPKPRKLAPESITT